MRPRQTGLKPGTQLGDIYTKHEPRGRVNHLSLSQEVTENVGLGQIRCSVELPHYGIHVCCLAFVMSRTRDVGVLSTPQACLEKGFSPFSHEALRPEGLQCLDSELEEPTRGKDGPGLAFASHKQEWPKLTPVPPPMPGGSGAPPGRPFGR